MLGKRVFQNRAIKIARCYCQFNIYLKALLRKWKMVMSQRLELVLGMG